MTKVLDKQMVREALLELLKKEPDFVQQLLDELAEVLKDQKIKELESIIDAHFEEYDDVFKALA